jgi:hypothetical protein
MALKGTMLRAIVTDLVFTGKGCRKIVTRYVGPKGYCYRNSDYFNPPRISSFGGRRFGDGFYAWVAYTRVVLRLPYLRPRAHGRQVRDRCEKLRRRSSAPGLRPAVAPTPGTATVLPSRRARNCRLGIGNFPFGEVGAGTARRSGFRTRLAAGCPAKGTTDRRTGGSIHAAGTWSPLGERKPFAAHDRPESARRRKTRRALHFRSANVRWQREARCFYMSPRKRRHRLSIRYRRSLPPRTSMCHRATADTRRWCACPSDDRAMRDHPEAGMPGSDIQST